MGSLFLIASIVKEVTQESLVVHVLLRFTRCELYIFRKEQGINRNIAKEIQVSHAALPFKGCSKINT